MKLALPTQGEGLALPTQGQGLALPTQGEGLALPTQGEGLAPPTRREGLAPPTRREGLAPPTQRDASLRPPGHALAGGDLAAFARALADAPDRWRHLVRHSAHARVYELIWADEHVNAWVICWSAGQDTGFHDHGSSAGAIHVVDGVLCEERLSLGRPAGEPRLAGRVFGRGMSLSVPKCAIHRVFHGGGGPAVSVHAYSPPLTQMRDFRWAPDGELEREPRACLLPAATVDS